MSGSAQRKLMEMPVDASNFSGGSREYDKIVTKYSSEVGNRYRAILFHQKVEEAKSSGPGYWIKTSDVAEPKILDKALKETEDLLHRKRDPLQQPRVTFTPIQEWEGFVTSINEEAFTAKLCDVKDEHGVPTDEVEFDLKELPASDRNILVLGSIVRWAIGLERHPNDRRQRVSRIYLRRLPVFTKSDISRAEAEAESLMEMLAI